MYQIITENPFVWIESKAFSESGMITHGFSTKHGGISPFPYQSLNLGLHTQDNNANVRENRVRLMKRFGIDAHEVTSLHFVHSNTVVQVSKEDGGRGFLSADSALADADGMITNVPRRALFITFADCVPILFFDPVHQAIGACHAGWRGTVSGIAQKTLQAMEEAYGTKPEEVLVAVGPAIDPNHFEIGPEVAKAVAMHSQAPETLLKKRANGKYLFDIWQANVDQLFTLGVPREAITVIDLSTFVRDDLFFSHRRRLVGDVGRMGAFIMLNRQEDMNAV